MYNKNVKLNVEAIQIDNKELSEKANLIKSIFPGLTFFVQSKKDISCITIPGINLPENDQVISKGVISQNIMKSKQA